MSLFAASCRLLQAPPGCGVPYSRRQGTLPTDPQGASNIPLQHESLPTAADWPEAAPAGGSLEAAWKPGLAWRQVRAVSRSLCCFLVSHPGLFTWSRLVGHLSGIQCPKSRHPGSNPGIQGSWLASRVQSWHSGFMAGIQLSSLCLVLLDILWMQCNLLVFAN